MINQVLLLVLVGLSDPRELSLFVGTGYLASPGANGNAVSTGIRLRTGHAALSFDLGYGLLSTRVGKQDRWWLIPAAAVVIPAGPVTFDLGAGVGLGTSSGFSSFKDWSNDRTTWEFQLIPAARAHAVTTLKLTDSFELFVRLDVASLLLDRNSAGFQTRRINPGISETVWIHLWVGGQFRLL